jgi:hypothetical protein
MFFLVLSMYRVTYVDRSILLFRPHFLISGVHLQWLRSIVVIEIRVFMNFGYIECSRILISCAENYPPVVRRIYCAKHPRTLIASRSPPAGALWIYMRDKGNIQDELIGVLSPLKSEGHIYHSLSIRGLPSYK